MTTIMGKPIGEILREGRLHQRLSIAECAKRTHISPRYIEALEEERWTDLPSESHRMGFLRLYAKFLGVYSEDLERIYRESQQPPPVEKPVETPKPIRPKPSGSTTWHRLILWIIFGLVVLWGLYHAVRRYKPDHVDLTWLKPRQSVSQAPRLVTPVSSSHVQRIRVRAESATWLRISDPRQLLFEGVLPAGMAKEWSGPGPYRIRIGDIRGLVLHWNDQPVDLSESARGTIADLRLPPSSDSDRR